MEDCQYMIIMNDRFAEVRQMPKNPSPSMLAYPKNAIYDALRIDDLVVAHSIGLEEREVRIADYFNRPALEFLFDGISPFSTKKVMEALHLSERSMARALEVGINTLNTYERMSSEDLGLVMDEFQRIGSRGRKHIYDSITRDDPKRRK